MVVNTAGFLVGVVVLFSLAQAPSPAVLVAVALLALLASRISPRLLFPACGFLYAALHTLYFQQQNLPETFFGVESEVIGRVTGLPEHDGSRLRFLLQIDSLRLAESTTARQFSGSTVRLNWYGRDVPDVRAGDQLRLPVKLRQPAGFLNPGGFDYEKWLFQQRIVATGYVRSKHWQPEMVLDSGALYHWSTARNQLRDKLIVATRGLSSQGLILGLAVGDRSLIDRTQWQHFIATGTNHLLAISGLHISLVAGFVGLLVGVAWRYWPALQRVSRGNCSLYGAAVAALIYAAMAGFALPTQRALLMFIVLAGLALLRRHQRRTTALALALLAVILVDPLAVMAPGLWMSFTAVAILYLVFAYAPKTDWRYRVGYALRGHLLITLGLYPLTVLFFQQASLVSPLANFIAVPLVGLVITPLVFVCTLLAAINPVLARLPLLFADGLLRCVDWMLALMADLPVALLRFKGAPELSLLFLMVAAVLLLVPVPGRLRLLVPLLILPLFYPRFTELPAGAYRVTFLDVGQGTAVVVRTRHHVLVYDTGPQFSASFNSADAVIIPYLASQGVSAIDTLLISHNDRDHSGGVEELVDGLPVSSVLSSVPLPQLPEHSIDLCRAGQRWLWDEVRFEILHPTASDSGSENDLSCVLLISTPGQKHTLLPGDVEARGERQLITRGLPDVDVLMAPHHGSNTSSGAAFVAAVAAEYVVYTVGFKNRFDFPRLLVQARYRQAGAREFNVSDSGATEFTVADNTAIKITRYRRDHPRIWRRQDPDVFQGTATLY